MAKTLKITQVRSVSGRKYDQRQTLEALGIRRLGHTVVKPDNPAIRGMILKIVHLLKVTEG
ncbi:MAG TPA: 50S ribosomal protein L30 [Candidatus Saccharimonadales bacterium]|nr:50S ribosomal protein L30 [Candidatus Saccharimonadales bacterium]